MKHKVLLKKIGNIRIYALSDSDEIPAEIFPQAFEVSWGDYEIILQDFTELKKVIFSLMEPN